eukprot:SAG11_NODE_38060_length_254_cov_0.658065_1_plen_20_part_01
MEQTLADAGIKCGSLPPNAG